MNLLKTRTKKRQTQGAAHGTDVYQDTSILYAAIEAATDDPGPDPGILPPDYPAQEVDLDYYVGKWAEYEVVGVRIYLVRVVSADYRTGRIRIKSALHHDREGHLRLGTSHTPIDRWVLPHHLADVRATALDDMPLVPVPAAPPPPPTSPTEP